MNHSNYSYKIVTWLATIVEFQLFIALISLPILIAWGLPISLLSLLGNSIFTPFLAGALFLSSLIFFCELFYISNTYLAYLLNYIISCWSTLMSFGSNSCLIAFKKPPHFILFIVFFVIVLIIHYSIRKSLIQRISIYLAFLIIFSALNNKLLPSSAIEYISYHNRTLTLINTHKSVTLIDPAAFTQRGNITSFVEYTLVQTIAKKTGRLMLDHVIIAKPTIQVFKGLKKLLSKMHVSYLYLPMLKGNFSAQFCYELDELTKEAKKRNCMLIFITEKYDIDNTLFIRPLSHYSKIDTGYYKAAKITGQIDNTAFTFYSP